MGGLRFLHLAPPPILDWRLMLALQRVGVGLRGMPWG